MVTSLPPYRPFEWGDHGYCQARRTEFERLHGDRCICPCPPCRTAWSAATRISDDRAG